jgi:MFS-type transporter involved in bile tolerance (Atg22 family)
VSFIVGYPEDTGYGLGLTSTQVALVLMPAATAALVAGIAGGPLLTVIGARRQAILGGLLAASCYVALLALSTTAAGPLRCAGPDGRRDRARSRRDRRPHAARIDAA